jgi:hypothetical protein
METERAAYERKLKRWLAIYLAVEAVAHVVPVRRVLPSREKRRRDLSGRS